eukprot:superscaffoldBa00001159_g9251
MRFLVPLFVFLAVAVFQSDQMEFEAAQKSEAAQMNVTEEQNEDGRYLVEERIEAEDDNTAEGGGNSDVAAHEESSSTESSEEADGEQMYWSEKAQQLHADPNARSSPGA